MVEKVFALYAPWISRQPGRNRLKKAEKYSQVENGRKRVKELFAYFAPYTNYSLQLK